MLNPQPLWQLQKGTSRFELIVRQLSQFNCDISDQARDSKYAKMSQDPFVFYRGTAHLYYHDLCQQQVLQNSLFADDEAVTWLQGDLHVENYGAFCDGMGDVIYDLNDFDESWIDCYLYDLYRLAASLLLVIERQDVEGQWHKRQLLAVLSDAYFSTLAELKQNPQLKLVKLTEANTTGKLQKFLTKAKAANSRRQMLDKWTVLENAERRFDLQSHKLEAVDEATRQALILEVEAYHHRIESELKGKEDYFKVVDVAKRVHAGTGSLGTPRFYVLIDGHSESEHDYRILDVKQQGLPSHYPYLSDHSLMRMRSLFPKDSQGCRVAAAQRAMHVHADDHLGSVFIDGHSYSVRERSPYKKTLNTTKLSKLKHMTSMAQQWGSILATAHARADRDFDSGLLGEHFEDVLTALVGERHQDFHHQVFCFADNYCQQVHIDYELFLQAREHGRL